MFRFAGFQFLLQEMHQWSVLLPPHPDLHRRVLSVGGACVKCQQDTGGDQAQPGARHRSRAPGSAGQPNNNSKPSHPTYHRWKKIGTYKLVPNYSGHKLWQKKQIFFERFDAATEKETKMEVWALLWLAGFAEKNSEKCHENSGF